MRKICIILLVGIAIGAIIGFSLPWKFFSDACSPSLLDVCEHGFWDWTLRVLEVVGTLLAVAVALFKEDWVAYRFKPNLVLDKDHCDIYARKANGYIVRYDAVLVISNLGRAKANNLKISIDRIEYSASVPGVNIQTVSSEPYNLIFHGGSNQVCIPTYDEIRVGLLSLLQAQIPMDMRGRVQTIPPLSLMIGQKQIPSNYHNGVIDVALTIKCDELKPQKHSLRIEWNGAWRNTKAEMQEMFSYKWVGKE